MLLDAIILRKSFLHAEVNRCFKDRCVLVLILHAFYNDKFTQSISWKYFSRHNAPFTNYAFYGNCWRVFVFKTFHNVYADNHLADGVENVIHLKKPSVAVLACKIQPQLPMNSNQHRCTNQASATKAHTEQRLLSCRWGNGVCSPFIYLGSELLNSCTPIRPNASPQPSSIFVICGPWCTTFSTSLF